jgi:hypothetical protein
MRLQAIQSTPPTTPRAVMPTPAARSLAFDLYRGVVWGDFDLQLGVAGAIAQSVIGFVPGVGTITALRDLLACLGQRDLLGIVLNILAAFPVFGGLAKTTDALHTLHRYHRAAQRRKQRAMDGWVYQAHGPHRSGWASFGLSLLVACCAALYGVGVRTLLEFLGTHGPKLQGLALRGDGAWLAPLLLLPLGLLVGLAVTVRNRLWLGLTLLPCALAVGFAVVLTGRF